MQKNISKRQGSPAIATKEKALLIIRYAEDKQAEDPLVLDMRKCCNFCDFFVIFSAASSRKARAIADSIAEGLITKDIKSNHIEGRNEGLWILLDYSDVIVHIFQKDLRPFYNLERLWLEAEKISL